MTGSSASRDRYGRNLEHKELWRHAKSLAEAGELTAQWLEGKVEYQPTYFDAAAARETGPLIDQLARLNRSGVWTTNSQPGEPLVEGNAQRQYVTGYCSEDTAAVIEQVTLYSELAVMLFAPERSAGGVVPVTIDGGSTYTTLGLHQSLTDPGLAADLAEETNEEFVSVLSSCWYFEAFDPVWGRNDRLLPALLTVLD